MSNPKEKPVHYQIADAGFGEAVEAKGFRKVGRTYWRLDGDGIIHHLMLRPGPRRLPGSFRDYEAATFPEYERLCEKCSVPSGFGKLPLGKGIHHSGDFDQIAWHDYYRQREIFEVEHPEPERTFWQEIVHIFKRGPDRPNFDLRVYRPPFGWKWDWNEQYYRKRGEWRPAPGQLEEVTKAVVETWERSSWPRIAAVPSWQAYYEKHERALIKNRHGFSPTQIILAFLGGDHRLIQEIIDSLAEQVGPPVEEAFQLEWKDCLREIFRKDWKRFRHTPEGLRILRGRAIGRAFSGLHHLREAERVAGILEIDVRMPEVDYSEFDHLDREAYRNKPLND